MSDELDQDKTPTAGRRRYNKLAAASAATAVAGAGVLLFAFNTATGSAEPSAITLCHATASTTHPYQVITVAPNAIQEKIFGTNGHASHTGPVFDPNGGKTQTAWGDIIPSFSYDDPAINYPGMNLTTEGLAILANDCVVPQAGPTTTSVSSSMQSSGVEGSSTSVSSTAASSTAESSGVAPTSEVNTPAVPVVTVTETEGGAVAPAQETAPLPNAVGAGRHTTASSQDLALGGALMVLGLGGLASAVRPWKRGSH